MSGTNTINFPIPYNETKRLKALQDYELLDSIDEAEFDRITELASIICDVPISLVSLIDETRQWFKSNHGLQVKETSRDLAFCQYAIMDSVLFEVEDATKDERFYSNDLVLGDPNIRFYAGYPLIDAKGFALGTLCVIDRKPKQLNSKQKRALQILANDVMALIEERRQKAELLIIREELKFTREMLEQTNQVARVGGWSFDVQQQKTYWTSVTKEIHGVPFGYEPSLDSGIDFYKEGENRKAIRKALDHGFKEGKPWDLQLQLINAQGEEIWVRAIGTAKFEHGKCIRLLGTFQDITYYKLAELALHESIVTQEALNQVLLKQIDLIKEKDTTIDLIKEYKFLADSIPQIVFTARPDGFSDYYNQHWFDYTGMTRENSPGYNWLSILHPDDRERSAEAWNKAVQTGEPYEIEYRFKRASDGVYRWHLGRSIPMKNDNGDVIKWFGSCTDIDEYKRALDLEDKISHYEDFNHIVAHNLRGPAGSIRMLLGMLNAAGADETEKHELLSMLDESSKSLNETLNNLMKVLEVRNNNLPFEDCNLQTITDDVEKMLKGQFVSVNATIITDFKTPIISYPSLYLESIFYNMISNALKYCKADVPPLIEISSIHNNNKVLLTFKDNGLGIDLKRHGEDIFKLNQVFHAGYDSKGVGLFMTKTQIETFGGRIRVESEPGKGSVFTIEL
jgi:PAS domain S-box-containing protein